MNWNTLFTKEDVISLYKGEFSDFMVISISDNLIELSGSNIYDRFTRRYIAGVYERRRDWKPAYKLLDEGKITEDELEAVWFGEPWDYTLNEEPIPEEEWQAARFICKDVLIEFNGGIRSTFNVYEDYLVEGGNSVQNSIRNDKGR